MKSIKVWEAIALMIANIIVALGFLAAALIVPRQLMATGDVIAQKAVREAIALAQSCDLHQDQVARVRFAVGRWSSFAREQFRFTREIWLAVTVILAGNAWGWGSVARRLGAAKRLPLDGSAGSAAGSHLHL
jgi:NO-binding membrane sensor protein with MHYT domain